MAQRQSRNRNRSKPKTINPKYMTTSQLKALRDNDYVGINGLDREQYQEEIDSIYYTRSNKLLEDSVANYLYQLEQRELELEKEEIELGKDLL